MVGRLLRWMVRWLCYGGQVRKHISKARHSGRQVNKEARGRAGRQAGRERHEREGKQRVKREGRKAGRQTERRDGGQGREGRQAANRESCKQAERQRGSKEVS